MLKILRNDPVAWVKDQQKFIFVELQSRLQVSQSLHQSHNEADKDNDDRRSETKGKGEGEKD